MKKITALILTVRFLFCGVVFAEIESTEYDMTSSVVTVSGIAESGKDISIIVFNPDKEGNVKKSEAELSKYILKIKEAAESESAGRELIQNQAVTVTDIDGEYELSVKIRFDGDNDSGYYTFYLNGRALENAEIFQMYIASDDDKKNAIADINKAAEEEDLKKLEEYLTQYNEILGFNLSEFAGYAEFKIEEVSEKLTEIIKENAIKEDDYEGAKKLVRRICLLECYNRGIYELCQQNNEFINRDLIDFSEIDKLYGITLYDVFEKVLNESAKEKVISGLFKKECNTVDALYKVFAENVAVYGMDGTDKGGTEHISLILTKDNAKFIGVEADGYFSQNNKSEYHNKLINANISSVKDINDLLAGVNTETPEKKPTGGGSGGGSAGIINVMPRQEEEPTQTETETAFSDVPKEHWAWQAVEYLHHKGIVNGIGEKTFAPDESVTREQFVTMLFRAFKPADNGYECLFSDCVSTGYYYDAVRVLNGNGYVFGINEDEFGVCRKITRQDMVTIAFRMMNVEESSFQIEFADADDISDYAVSAVKAMVENKILNGFSDNTLRPKETCTRAQVAKIIYSLIQYEMEEDNE